MNTKHPKYKDYLKLEREISVLEAEQKKNCRWITLDKPIRNGYLKTYTLREDVSHRADAWVFLKVLALTVSEAWSREKHFRRKLRKGRYEIVKPDFRSITEKTYEKLHPKVKRMFFEIEPGDREYSIWQKRYKISRYHFPSYYLVEKIKPNYITKIYERDFSNESLIDEKEDQSRFLANYNGFWGRTGAPSWCCSVYHRSDRRHSKQTVKKIVESGDYDTDQYELRYAHRNSATWDWW